LSERARVRRHYGPMYATLVVAKSVSICHDNEQALVSLKLKKSVDAEGGSTLAVILEGG